MFRNAFQKGNSKEIQSTVPTTSNLRKAGSQKLRASCDSCYTSKIKCTKETPTCMRCINHGVPCNYSPSLRIGKPRRRHDIGLGHDASIQEPVKNKSLQCRSINDGSSQQRPCSWDSNAGTSTSDPGLGTIDEMSLEWPQTSQMMGIDNSSCIDMNQLDHSSLPSSMLSSPLESILEYPLKDYPLDHLPTTIESLFGIPINGKSANTSLKSPTGLLSHTQTLPPSVANKLTMLQTEFPQTYLPSPTSPLHPSILSYPATNIISTCTCATDGFEVLSILHSQPQNTHTTFSLVLATNKTAVHRTSLLLSCPCPRDSPAIILLAVLISKILSCYQQISTRSPQPLFPTTTTPATNSNNPLHTTTVSNNNTTITLGGYTLDPNTCDSGQIKMQVVLSELRKVDALLVGGFHERFCKSGGEALGRGPGLGLAPTEPEGKHEARIYAELGVFLARRLRDIVEGVEGGLLPCY